MTDMKHLRTVSKHRTAPAATWQDTLCAVINFVGVVFGSFGAASPFLNILLDKCDPTT
jgi:hypothetical protein